MRDAGSPEKGSAWVMNDVMIRHAVRADVPEIARIYNHAILNTTATFDTEPKTLEERSQWFENHSHAYPLIVATIDGAIAGWASLRPFGTRLAYRFTVENAIYVDVGYQGRGVGSALMNRLVELAEELGYHVIIALIVGGNEGSEKLHVKHGFTHVGTMREVGYKFDRWLDVLTYELVLDSTRK